MSETIINQKTHAELQAYLTAEHGILTASQYRKSFEYIEELINRNVMHFNLFLIIFKLKKKMKVFLKLSFFFT